MPGSEVDHERGPLAPRFVGIRWGKGVRPAALPDTLLPDTLLYRSGNNLVKHLDVLTVYMTYSRLPPYDCHLPGPHFLACSLQPIAYESLSPAALVLPEG